MLHGVTIDVPPSITREEAVRRLRELPESVLVLDTCQRLEVYGPADMPLLDLPVSTRWESCAAFERLARIAAGLESRILGELEVLGQVRSAYKTFQKNGDGAPRGLDGIFQEALGLARKARRVSGIDQQMTSLSGLAARDMLSRIPAGQPIAVIGSGSLATSIIRYLGKRGNSPIRVSSRCPENAMNLALQVGGFGSGLDELVPLLNDVAGIICATAAPHPILYPEHLPPGDTLLAITDLGVPPDCSAEVRNRPHLTYQDLEAVENQAAGNLLERQQRAEQAAALIRSGALAWSAKR